MERKSIGTRLGVAFGALVFGWVLFLLFFDIGEIDDSDLALPAREVDPAQNPYSEIRDIELSEEERADLRRVSGMLLGSEEMNSAFLLERLDRHRPLLDRFYRYAVMEEWRQDRSGDLSSRYAMNWSTLIPLAVVDGAYLARRSKTAAVDAHLSILRFAANLQSSEINTIEWIVGWRMRADAYRGLLFLLEREPMERGELVRVAEALEDPQIRSLHFDLMVRAEYASSKAMFSGIEDDPLGSGIRWIPLRAVYKPNRTLQGLAESHRQSLQLSETTLTEVRPRTKANATPSRVSKWMQILGGNWQGYDLVSSFESSLLNMAEHSFISRAYHEVLRTRVALERYRLKHGVWPPDLAALVPAYLDAVPLDPIDGKPLRYDRERKVLYSIGDNLIDEKGVAPDRSGSLRSRAEIVIELEPTELAPWPDFGQPAPTDERTLSAPPSDPLGFC